MASFWVSTCSSLKRGQEPDWADVQHYEEPLKLLLAGYRARGQLDEVDDLVQDILIEIKERLYARYDSERGKFRAFLGGVVQNKLREHWRKHARMRSLEAADPVPAFTEDQSSTVDFLAEVLISVRRWHNRYGHGKERDRQRIYVFADCLIHRLGLEETAVREKLSIATVKRILQAARDEIVGDLLERTIQLSPAVKAGLDWARLGRIVRTFRTTRGARGSPLDDVSQPEVRRALDLWLDVHENAMRHIPESDQDQAAELRHGLTLLFDGQAAAD